MALPYPMSPVSPFDVITSQAENEKIANIESLADGTGIDDGSITAPKLDWTSINLGYSSGTTSQTISTTDTNITGVSTTITSTGLRVRLEAVLNFVISSNAWGIVSIYEGSTLIKQASAYSNGANATATVVAYITPTAGSHTYTLRARTNAGSMTTHSDLAGREAFLAVSVA